MTLGTLSLHSHEEGTDGSGGIGRIGFCILTSLAMILRAVELSLLDRDVRKETGQ